MGGDDNVRDRVQYARGFSVEAKKGEWPRFREHLNLVAGESEDGRVESETVRKTDSLLLIRDALPQLHE